MMIQYRLRLSGPKAQGPRISAELLRDLLNVFTQGARGALRLRVEGRSAARGHPPAWLSAADFDVVGLAEGSTVLVFEANPVGDAVHGGLNQGELFEPFDPNVAALSLVQESLQQALEGREDSELFDEALLAEFETLGAVFAKGVSSIELSNGSTGGRAVRVTADRIETISRLRRKTPPPQRVRVAGWLDQIRHSDRMFTVKLESGATLRGVAQEIPPDELSALWGRKAVVSARAIFRPSGRVLRLEADHIEAAGQDFSLWSVEPKPLFDAGTVSDLRHPQGPRSGLNAIIGQWPGDETDEEIERWLAELS